MTDTKSATANRARGEPPDLESGGGGFDSHVRHEIDHIAQKVFDRIVERDAMPSLMRGIAAAAIMVDLKDDMRALLGGARG